MRGWFFLFILCPLLCQAGVRQDLAALYPEQSSATLEQRIALLNSPNDFFRAFGPYFYLRAKKNLLNVEPWKSLKGHQGWCAGDAHPKNFGVLLSERNQPLYSINDVDDSNPCPVIADVLRFLTGWGLIVGDDLSTAWLPPYLAGLEGRPLQPPAIVRQLMEKGRERGLAPKSKWVDPKTGAFRPLDELSPVNGPLAVEISQQAQRIAGPGWEILELRERLRMEGGSGGLKRFLILLKGPKNVLKRQPLLLEFKEIAPRPATAVLDVPRLDPQARISHAWKWEQGPSVTRWHRFARIAGHLMMSRPLWDGNVDIDVEKMSFSERQGLALYQASLLGWLHRQGAVPADFADDLRQVPTEAWTKSLHLLVREMNAAYTEVR
ncbi:MAG: DUF2252 family protein [Bdellovibrionaceae bacterium]|nr:DUF2252 family protein [Pseudobdellovibrionaceae bacterium]